MEKQKDPKKVKRGKKSKAQGATFEKKTREDLIEKGWIVDRWSNNVEIVNDGSISDFIFRCECGRTFSFISDYNGMNGEEMRNSEEREIMNMSVHVSETGHKIKKIAKGIECSKFGKLIPAKVTWRRTPKGMFPMGLNSGFPDFVAFRRIRMIDDAKLEGFTLTKKGIEPEMEIKKSHYEYEIIGVESKMTGELDKLEKQKCRWYLDKGIFSKILVARKTKVKNRIVVEYEDFLEIEKRMMK